MGIIDKFVNNVTGSRAIDVVQGAGDRLASLKQGIQGFVGGLINTIANGSPFVGMSTSGADKICAAIETYVSDIQKLADELNTEADVQQAIRGDDVVKSVQDYVIAIQDVCKAYVSHLLAYRKTMQNAAKSFITDSQTKLAGDVAAEAKNLSGSVEMYSDAE